MSASYPSSIKTFTVKTAKQDKARAADVNAMQDEITAIETELGTNPAGSKTTVKDRLAVNLADDGATAKGTSFPASPTAGQLFYRTDEDKLYSRDAANANWKVVGETLSNMIFSWVGKNVLGMNNGLAVTTSSSAPTSSDLRYVYLMTDQTSYTTVITIPWRKISGVNTIVCHGTAGGFTYNGRIQVDIGGQVGSVLFGNSGLSNPSFTPFSIDISSLTNGTLYDILIQLRTETSGGVAALWEVFLEGQS